MMSIKKHDTNTNGIQGRRPSKLEKYGRDQEEPVGRMLSFSFEVNIQLIAEQFFITVRLGYDYVKDPNLHTF